MSENMEMIPIHNLESDDRDSPPAICDAVHPSSSISGAEEDMHDVEQTPASSVPLLSLESGSSQVDRGPSLVSILKWALMSFSPVIGIAYLAFCYVVHYRVVPANVFGLTNTGTQVLSEHLNSTDFIYAYFTNN